VPLRRRGRGPRRSAGAHRPARTCPAPPPAAAGGPRDRRSAEHPRDRIGARGRPARRPPRDRAAARPLRRRRCAPSAPHPAPPARRPPRRRSRQRDHQRAAPRPGARRGGRARPARPRSARPRRRPRPPRAGDDRRGARAPGLRRPAGALARLGRLRPGRRLALLAAAERLTARRPGAGALDLVEQIRAPAVVEATLAPAAAARGRIAVLTPAQLAGEHRDTVVLARVQEGAWPDLRLRSTLFGAAELSLWAGARRGAGLPLEADALRALQREQVIADELRLAVSALSRARRRVLVTAVQDEQNAPSALFDALVDLAAPTGSEGPSE